MDKYEQRRKIKHINIETQTLSTKHLQTLIGMISGEHSDHTVWGSFVVKNTEELPVIAYIRFI